MGRIYVKVVFVLLIIFGEKSLNGILGAAAISSSLILQTNPSFITHGRAKGGPTTWACPRPGASYVLDTKLAFWLLSAEPPAFIPPGLHKLFEVRFLTFRLIKKAGLVNSL